jgi:hypothetical protein
MTSTGWKFRYLPEDQKHTEPTHSQEFGRNGAARSLVREAIQNSLDARLDPSLPVRVRIKLGIATGLDANWFLEELWPHLKAVRAFLKCSKKQASFRYLTFEDFNTRGLAGDVKGKSATHQMQKNHFFCFWHKVGQSSNDHKTLGNRGVGKVAFQVASGISTFFGLTRRAEDPDNAYLMGEAGLVTHDDPHGSGHRCDWYGYFAVHESIQARARPVVDASTIKRFSSVFGLEDGRATPGLSVVVPYADEKIEVGDLLFHTLDTYMVSIARGELVLEVLGIDGEHIVVEGATLMKVVDDLCKRPGKHRDDLAELQLMAELALQLAHAESHEKWLELNATLDTSQGGGRYKLLARDEQDLIVARKECEESGRVRARIQVHVARCDDDAADPDDRTRQGEHEILVYGRMDQESKNPNWNHVRCGLHVSKLRREGPAGSRGFVLVGRLAMPGLLAQLLQKSEEAAHDTWQLQGPEYKNAKESFENARELILLCRGAANRVADLVRPASELPDKSALATFLPVVSVSGPRPKPPRPKPGETPRPITPPDKAAAGVVEFAVYKWPGSEESHALRNVSVSLRLLSKSGSESTWNQISDSRGRALFEGLAAGRYEAKAEAEKIGSAVDEFDLPESHGLYRKLVLVRQLPPAALVREPLPDGFIVRFHPGFDGVIGRVHIRMAYAGYGGDVKFVDGDFDLQKMDVQLRDVLESVSASIVRPNALVVTPLTRAFEVSVRGFNRRFALSVDARHRAIDEALDPEGVNQPGGEE